MVEVLPPHGLSQAVVMQSSRGRGGVEVGRRGRGGRRDVLEERRHSPFQVLDASAIEGIRGLVGESASKYSGTQIYKALTPPAPPSVSRRDGRTWAPSFVGSSEERPCPDLGPCTPPSAPAGAAVGGWVPPPPDGCTCRVKPRLESPPPGRPADGCRLTVCPTCCPAAADRGGVGRHLRPPAARHPGKEEVHPVSLLPAPLQWDVPMGRGGGGGGCDAVAGCTASGGARSHRPPGDMKPEPLRLSARGWACD